MSELKIYASRSELPDEAETLCHSGNGNFQRRSPDCLEIIYISHGSFSVKSSVGNFSLSAGDIAVFNPFENYEGVCYDKKSGFYIFTVPSGIIRRAYPSDFSFLNIIRNSRECKTAVKKAAEYSASGSPESYFLMLSEIFRFLSASARDFSVTQTARAEYAEKKKRMVGDIIEKISLGYSENINISSLASAFFVSVSHLQHTFKEYTGLSIVDYINKTRIDNSKRLLRETDLHVSVIAEMVGIADYNYFSRVFKKYEGISPSDYRKSRPVIQRD